MGRGGWKPTLYVPEASSSAHVEPKDNAAQRNWLECPLPSSQFCWCLNTIDLVNLHRVGRDQSWQGKGKEATPWSFPDPNDLGTTRKLIPIHLDQYKK